jgi:hypothetical protein
VITLDEYLMGRHAKYPLTQEMRENAIDLLRRVNGFLLAVPDPLIWQVSSGYRPPEINAKTPGAAKLSLHQTCQAVDIVDDGRLTRWAQQFALHQLMVAELYMEHPRDTPAWCHLQSKPPKSGNRIFFAR